MEIPCNPANPVLYLAGCGLFDLLARMDPAATGCWRTSTPAALLLESPLVPEAELLATVLDTFAAPERWVPESPADGGEPTAFHVHFDPPRERPKFSVPLDWWFETAELDGSITANSSWKMFAGRQTVGRITLWPEDGKLGMVPLGARLKAAGQTPASLGALLECEVAMSGRFGFDPRSSRNALDVGYSSNDLGLPVKTALFAELLAVFGLSSFFPARTGRAGDLESTRGWRGAEEKGGERGFLYVPWSRPLPVTLARLAARPTPGTPAFFSPRDDSRGKYKNLTLARTIPTTPPNRPKP